MNLRVASQNKAEAAQKAGKFADEIVAFTIKTRKGEVMVDADEYIRHGATLEVNAETAPGFRQGWHGHGGQCLGSERWRSGRVADDRLPKRKSVA